MNSKQPPFSLLPILIFQLYQMPTKILYFWTYIFREIVILMSFKCTGALQIGNLRFLTEGGRFRSLFTAPAGVGDLVPDQINCEVCAVVGPTRSRSRQIGRCPQRTDSAPPGQTCL